MEFTKYEGLGNDFIVVDGEAAARLGPDAAPSLCDRHFGIGADGVLLVSEPKQPGSRASMTVLNADGSRPEMCGNGLRCVALHLALAEGVNEASYAIDTDAGVRGCELLRKGDLAEVTLDMGSARLLPSLTWQHDGRSYEFHRVATGNPHAITFGPALDLEVIDRIAPRVSASIEGGANVEFVTQSASRAFTVVVWERGVGRTLACGTGAVACAAAAVASGKAQYGEPLSLSLPGGELIVTMREPGLLATLRGPARRVFAGHWLR